MAPVFNYSQLSPHWGKKEEKQINFENKLCPECGKKFILAEKVVEHKKSHDKREFPCELCGKTLAGKNNYYNHKNHHETF